jgi:hypothetical protein
LWEFDAFVITFGDSAISSSHAINTIIIAIAMVAAERCPAIDAISEGFASVRRRAARTSSGHWQNL